MTEYVYTVDMFLVSGVNGQKKFFGGVTNLSRHVPCSLGSQASLTLSKKDKEKKKKKKKKKERSLYPFDAQVVVNLQPSATGCIQAGSGL